MRFILALVSGAIFPLGFAPFEFWPLTLLSVLALIWLINKAQSAHSWVLWCFAVGKFTVGVSWVYVSMNVYGGASPPLAVLLVSVLIITLAFFYWPAGWVYGRWSARSRGSPLDVVIFATLFIGTEWLLTWLFTGFPWLFVGHAMLATPMHGLLPIFGVLGTGFVTVLSIGFVYVGAKRRNWIYVAASFALWLLSFGVAQVAWVSETSRHSVALVQGNLDQNRKWLAQERLPNFHKHLDLSKSHWDADLIMWPEAAITMVDATDALEYISRQGKTTSTSIVVGIPAVERLTDGGLEITNTALALGTGQGQFAKQHLVPFGEYVPLQGLLRGLIAFFDLPMSSSVPGSVDQSNLKIALGGDQVEAAMAICYEVAYGETLRRHAQTAAVLMSISNDTWFGMSIGPLQHMQIAQTRSAENGRWLLRATNNGVTAIVDQNGMITQQLPQFEAGTLRGEFAVMQGHTPYNRLGDWPLLVTMAVVLGLATWRTHRLS
jgi:apolipoprotein N-acyltransferase